MMSAHISSAVWVCPTPSAGIHIISIAVDAPQDVISSLAGKLGNIPNVSVKIAYSNVIGHD